jgi:hypothetical protein
MNKQYVQNFQIYVELIREICNVLARFGSKSFIEGAFYTGNIPSENMTFSFFLSLGSRSLAHFLWVFYTITILLRHFLLNNGRRYGKTPQ